MALELVGGAVVGAVIGELLKAVLEAKDKASNFRHILASIEDTLKAIIPRLDEISRLNHILNLQQKEMEELIGLANNGKELVLKCSKVSTFSLIRKQQYSKELLHLDYTLLRYFMTTLQLDQSRDNKELLVMVRELHMKLASDKHETISNNQSESVKPVKKDLGSGSHEAGKLHQDFKKVEDVKLYNDCKMESLVKLYNDCKIELVQKPKESSGGGVKEARKLFQSSGNGEARPPYMKLMPRKDYGSGELVRPPYLAPPPLYSISPNGKFRNNIESWQKGDLLGRGVFGTVYKGYTDNGLCFAVKEVSLLDLGMQFGKTIHQLEQEISLLSQFEHENIVQYLGTQKDEARLYIFLELVTAKGSLASLYQKYYLHDSQVSAYTRQILNGLKYLHERNVVHRDIKCANILVDASGSVKLEDFGLAKFGTAFWMAPEVVNQKKNGYGLAADIWSLGCTVLEMLTRQIPYSHLQGIVGLEILLEPNRSILYDGLIWILGSIGLDIGLIYRKYDVRFVLVHTAILVFVETQKPVRRRLKGLKSPRLRLASAMLCLIDAVRNVLG